MSATVPRCWFCLWGLIFMLSFGDVQADNAFDSSSLALRTALHFDPGAEAPLNALLVLYQQVGRMKELFELYTQHLEQYPNDVGAKGVLARLWVESEDPRAEAFLESSLLAHPQQALLLHVQSVWQRAKGDPQFLDTLSAAVAAESSASRRALWLDELMKQAAESGRERVVSECFRALLATGSVTSEQRLSWAKRSFELGLVAAAALMLDQADFSEFKGERAVEVLLVQARVLSANQHRAKALSRARSALALLEVSHWRRHEVLMLCWQMATEAEREQMVTEAEKAWRTAPTTEAPALAYVELLMSGGNRAQGLNVLSQAVKNQPESRLLEERYMTLLAELHQEATLLTFLQDRISDQPARSDLHLRFAWLLMQQERAEEGRRELERLLADSTVEVKLSTWWQTARWLRSQNVWAEAVTILQMMLHQAPQRWDVRKELGELYALLKRPDELRALFDEPMPDEVDSAVRAEVVEFLIQQRLWHEAIRQLQPRVQKHPKDFESALRLSRIHSLLGNLTEAKQLLNVCRSLCDTDSRYASWLTVAWERALALETTVDLIEAEQRRLWPANGEQWDALRLGQLTTLMRLTAQAQWSAEAEDLLHAALLAPDVPVETKRELRKHLITTLEVRPNSFQRLEAELLKALKDDAEHGDLRLQLVMLYLRSNRLDLAKHELLCTDISRCFDADRVRQASAEAQKLGLPVEAATFAKRWVHLQPDDPSSWSTWTTLLMEQGAESELRAALREMRAHAKDLKLSESALQTVQRHLAASAWRSVSHSLSEEVMSADEISLCLSDMDSLDNDPAPDAWVLWARGLLARRNGDEAGMVEASKALSERGAWVTTPDGLSLSMTEAQRWLEGPNTPPTSAWPSLGGSDYSHPGKRAWMFEAMEDAHIQRSAMTPDASRVLVMDSHRRLYLLDRATGRLLWHVQSRSASLGRGSSSDPSGERLIEPDEWCRSDHHVCLLDEQTLTCRRLQDAEIRWQRPTAASAIGTQGCLANQQGRVYWWRSALGRLEALDETTGKLVWTQHLPQLATAPATSPSQPVWISSGLRVDGDRMLVWGNGAAMLSLEDGGVLWLAGSAMAEVSFPLETRDESRVTAAPSLLLSSQAFAASAVRFRGPFHRLTPVHPLGLPTYGFPGMYGSTIGGPWLLWGGDGDRWLQGDGLWIVSQSMASARYSVFGFPSAAHESSNSALNSAVALGAVGRSLIVGLESGVVRVQADGAMSPLLRLEGINQDPSMHPLPALAMDGSIIGIATRDGCRMIHAFSGATLWQCPWPEELAPWLQRRDQDLAAWQAMRWSSRGLFLHDGRSHTLALEWRGQMGAGDFIVPMGTHALMCLRCAPSRLNGAR